MGGGLFLVWVGVCGGAGLGLFVGVGVSWYVSPVGSLVKKCLVFDLHPPAWRCTRALCGCGCCLVPFV